MVAFDAVRVEHCLASVRRASQTPRHRLDQQIGQLDCFHLRIHVTKGMTVFTFVATSIQHEQFK